MEQLIFSVMSQLASHGVTVVFFATLAARLGAPVPASAILVMAGGMAATGHLPLLSIVAASIVANLLGDGVWFLAGRIFGNRMMRLLCKVSLSPDTCVRQSESLITQWGGSALIAAKFVPGISIVAAPMAGALRMKLLSFFAFDSLAAAIWVSAFLLPGWLFSAQIEAILNFIANAGFYGFFLLTLLVAAALVLRYRRRRKAMLAINIPRISVDELRMMLLSEFPPLVVDVRSEATIQIDSRRIPGAITVRLGELKSAKSLNDLFDIEKLDLDREIIFYCDCPDEISSALAAQSLISRGFLNARPLAGGLGAWLTSNQNPKNEISNSLARNY